MTEARISEVPGSVTAPRGFKAAGVACGIKASGFPDLAVIASDTPASAAAVFTTNLAQAAPVLVSREHLTRSGGRARAIVVNSGCANACTGDDGMQHARAMAQQTAAALGCTPQDVLVASTGVIGVKLDMRKVERGIQSAVAALSPSAGGDAGCHLIGLEQRSHQRTRYPAGHQNTQEQRQARRQLDERHAPRVRPRHLRSAH